MKTLSVSSFVLAQSHFYLDIQKQEDKGNFKQCAEKEVNNNVGHRAAFVSDRKQSIYFSNVYLT